MNFINIIIKLSDDKIKKNTLELGLQTYQILTNDDEVCILSLSSILLAVHKLDMVQTKCLASSVLLGLVMPRSVRYVHI